MRPKLGEAPSATIFHHLSHIHLDTDMTDYTPLRRYAYVAGVLSMLTVPLLKAWLERGLNKNGYKVGFEAVSSAPLIVLSPGLQVCVQEG